MTPEERQKLEEEYPSINWKRLGIALGLCGNIMLIAAVVL